MANLGPLYQNQTYSNLLQVDGGLTAELKPVLDGDGNASGLTLSLTGVGISGLVADSASNLYAGTAGALPYQVNTNVTGFVTAGTPGQFLLSNGASAPVWTTVTPSTLGALASNGSNSMTGNLSMGSNKIVNLLTPVSGTDAATKAYVDSIATGLQVKAACRLATTTNLTTLTGAATVDGVVVNTGDRVLVRAQTNPAENGIYVANVSTSPLGVWTRATDADTWAEIVGAATFITAGSTLANTTWVSNVAPGGTLDTTPITFVLFGASAAYTAGTGLSLVGSQFSLSTPVSVANGGSGVTTLTGYVKGNGTSAMTAVASIPNTDVSGLGTLSTQNANAVTLTGGTINGTSIGATTASTGAFTDLTASGTVNFSNYINVDPLVAAYFTTPRVWDSSKTHWYRITPSELTDNRYVTLPLLGTNDTFVFENHAQTLTNKTLTSPTINGGSISVTTTQTNWDAAYADRLKWDGGSAGLSAPTGRSSLGLGNIATISLPSPTNTTNFLRADGTWAAPAGGNYVTVNGFTTAAINAAISTAGSGGTIFLPAGTYSITSTIVLNNTNVIGCGESTKLIGSTASLGSANPILQVSTVCYLQNFYAAFDTKPSSATAGQYVVFWLGNAAVEFYGLQRNSYINGIWTGACGTSFYNPDTSSTNDTSVFSTTFSNLRVENFRYRGFDFRSPYRTGNVYSNIYVNTRQTGSPPNIVTDTCDTLFFLGGAESECTISQLNIEWATFTNAGMVLDHCNAFTITSLHFEHLTPSNNSAFIIANSSSGTIDSWTIYGNYAPQSPTPTPTGFSFFKINSANNNQNGSVTNNYTANYYAIGLLNLASYSTTNNPVIFSRGTNDGPVYVELGAYQYAGNSGENTYWATFPRSGNIEFISTGVNSNFGVPIRTLSGSTVFRNDTLTTAGSGATTAFYRPTTGSVAQFYVGSTASGQLYLPASGGTPAFYSGSDYRLKENLTPISNATDRMKQVKSYTYNLIGQSDTIEGFLAHELASVCPDAVLGEKDAIDEDGNPVYQQVAPAKLIPIMAQAIKDLIGRIESLENNNG